MPDDVWQSCGDLVSRLESRLAGDYDGDIVQATCADMIASLAAVTAATIESESLDRSLSDAGPVAGQPIPPDVVSSAAVTRRRRLIVRVWLDPTWDRRAECRSVIGETSDAIAALLSGGIARLELQACDDATDSISQLQRALQDDQSPNDSFHRIAKELSLTLGARQLSLLRHRRGRYRLVGSSVQPRLDPHARAVIEIQSIAKECDQRLSGHAKGQSAPQSAPQSALIIDDNDSESITSYLRTQDCQALYTTRFADGGLIVVAAAVHRDRLQLSPQQRLLFDLTLRDLLSGHPHRLIDHAFGWWSGSTRRWRKLLVAGLLLMGMCLPIRIHVAAEGRLVPRNEHWVYSPVAGNLEQIMAETGTPVAVGQALCEFSSDELDWKIIQLRGERLTLEEQIRIADTRRSDASPADVETERRVLETRLQSVSDQLISLEQRQSSWTIQSPIAGTVHQMTTEETSQWETPCPVTIGQPVIRVINLADGYRVELEVADQEIGYVLDAFRRADVDPVVCRFRIRATPHREQIGTLTKLSDTATLDRFGKRVIVATMEPQAIDPRFAADSGVVAWIECERAPAGYVLFRKVIERVRLWGWL